MLCAEIDFKASLTVPDLKNSYFELNYFYQNETTLLFGMQLIVNALKTFNGYIVNSVIVNDSDDDSGLVNDVLSQTIENITLVDETMEIENEKSDIIEDNNELLKTPI